VLFKINNYQFGDLIKLAIKYLASGCEHMKTMYFGAKDYDGWSGQRNNCRYGYGAIHGTIIFALGGLNIKIIDI